MRRFLLQAITHFRRTPLSTQLCNSRSLLLSLENSEMVRCPPRTAFLLLLIFSLAGFGRRINGAGCYNIPERTLIVLVSSNRRPATTLRNAKWISYSFEFPHHIACHYMYMAFCPNETYTGSGISTWVAPGSSSSC